MVTKVLVIISIVLTTQCRQIHGKEEPENEDFGNFADLAAELFQSQGAQGLGYMVQGLMGSALSNAFSGSEGGREERSATNLGQVLRGIGNMVGPNAQGIDTNVLSGIVGMIGDSLDPKQRSQGAFDMLQVLSSVSGVLNQPGNTEKLDQFTGYVPLLLDFVGSLYGPEAEEREKRHAGHSWLFPPVIERFHILADHFMNSDLGRKVVADVGAEKVVKIFSDESGRFNYDKFVELIENHTFRRHWIHMLTLRVGKLIEHYSNPKLYEQYVGMVQFIINGYLNKQGYPKSVLVDANTPVKSISALADFLSEQYIGTKIDSKYYIVPLMAYSGQVFDMMKEQSRARGGTEGISAKLADSINLEIIEPIARINRAYRYLKKNLKCDKYVLCLVNQRGPATDTLPGLKVLLSRGTSLAASWALSSFSEAPMIDYFSVIMYEDECEKFFKPDCSDYHDEEVRATTEYIHNEL